ncbi:hypothetical protein [Azohydromonas australica]|uniref:hypothetical protein n=1 Tax=Azohydromonas australica TaxID=364039 RepID=UPI00048A9D14|nr:hypothetical protein [Azohydromonas australica]
MPTSCLSTCPLAPPLESLGLLEPIPGSAPFIGAAGAFAPPTPHVAGRSLVWLSMPVTMATHTQSLAA